MGFSPSPNQWLRQLEPATRRESMRWGHFFSCWRDTVYSSEPEVEVRLGSSGKAGLRAPDHKSWQDTVQAIGTTPFNKGLEALQILQAAGGVKS